jgi:DUF438 domain-containing protein
MHDKINHIAPEGHPVHTLMSEHASLLQFADQLIEKTARLKNYSDYTEAGPVLGDMRALVELFKDSEKHYLREENILFAYLDKHGVSGPTQVMWTEHDGIRDLKKEFFPVLDNPGDKPFQEFIAESERFAKTLKQNLENHFSKENNILFPMALQTLSDAEWDAVLEEFASIGYCAFSPGVAEVETNAADTHAVSGGEIAFETGKVSLHVLESMLNTLPVEITFIDHEDTFRYFSQPQHMIFTRTKAALGNLVQNCHPKKSVHLVNQIIDDFRNGKRDIAEFWIDINNRKIYIRYFAVRDKSGKYLGCMEVTQDITELQKIEGQKRLLD